VSCPGYKQGGACYAPACRDKDFTGHATNCELDESDGSWSEVVNCCAPPRVSPRCLENTTAVDLQSGACWLPQGQITRSVVCQPRTVASTWWDSDRYRFQAATRAIGTDPDNRVLASGAYMLHVVLSGQPIVHSPYSLVVRAGPLSPADSGPMPDIFGSIEAGNLSTFAVVPRDRYHNIRNQTLMRFSDELTVSINGRALPPSNISWLANETLPAVAPWNFVVPHFRVQIVLTEVGVPSLQVQLGDLDHAHSAESVASADVKGSPYRIRVIPAPLDASNTLLHQLFDSNISAGTYTRLSLIARDRFGNNRNSFAANDTLTLGVTQGGETLCDRSAAKHLAGSGYTPCIQRNHTVQDRVITSAYIDISWQWRFQGADSVYEIQFLSNQTSSNAAPFNVSIQLGTTHGWGLRNSPSDHLPRQNATVMAVMTGRVDASLCESIVPSGPGCSTTSP
jgi:hypothetical protein